MIRKTVLYSGRVQGVGFRFTAQREASGYDVTGYVRNLPDGRVELVAEGREPEVDAFLGAVGDQMRHHIERSDVSTNPTDGRFERFEIRY